MEKMACMIEQRSIEISEAVSNFKGDACKGCPNYHTCKTLRWEDEHGEKKRDSQVDL